MTDRDLNAIVSTTSNYLSFSQQGEDRVLLRLVSEYLRKSPSAGGFYLDIGAFHPTNLSNTALLYNFFGWNGMNVDAKLESIRLFDVLRPDDINIHGLFSGLGQITTFYSSGNFSFGSDSVHLSSIPESRRQHFKETWAPSYSVENLIGMLKEKVVDFLNMDIEGLEEDVLRHGLLSGVKPAIVCVEHHQVKGEDLSSFLESNVYRSLASDEYVWVASTVISHFFVRADLAENSWR